MEVSVMGFGASPLGGIFREGFKQEDGIAAVHEAFNLGVNFFDTSPHYGDRKSERVLGMGLKGLPRDQIFVATKCGRYGEEFDFSAERVKSSVRESLRLLQLEYLDLVHCHDIEFVGLTQIIEETLPALQELKREGLVRNIGFSGLPLAIYPAILDRVPEGSVDVVLSYCHYSLNDTTLLDILPYLKRKGVGIINAGVLSMGLLTKHGPAAWNPAPQIVKDTCRKAVQCAAEQGVELPELAIKAVVASTPHISSHLIGCCTPEEVRQNVANVIAAFGERSDKEDQVLREVKDILRPIQGQTWPSGLPENN